MSALKVRRGPAVAGVAATALLGAGLLGSVAACGVVSSATTAPTAASTLTAHPVASTAASAPRSAAPAGATGSKSGVPWNQVGPNWSLANTSSGTSTDPGPSTLYLVSPTGSTYPVYRWPASQTPPILDAWSPSKTEALLREASKTGPLTNTYERLNLETGQVIGTFTLPNVDSVAYTLPDGQQLLVSQLTQDAGATQETATVARYSLAGGLEQTLYTAATSITSTAQVNPVASPDGTTIALGIAAGVGLVSNAGGTLTRLTVPGESGCSPVRWWGSSTVLAACTNAGNQRQLWLVPDGGAAATALTPIRQGDDSGTNVDLGDIDAWQVSSGLYLQSLGPCGALELNKQAANGSYTTVTIPDAGSIVVVTSDGSRLLLDTRGCAPGNTLMWYNPASGSATVALKSGVVEVIPFASEQDPADIP
ncbi:MAG TPA: hypothetical protein VGG83_25160 [Trebonia sp.]